MSDFIAIATANETDHMEISNIPFFPAINVNDFRNTQRLDGTITTPRIKTAIIDAILTVNEDLYSWRLAKQMNGINSISDLTDELINGESKFVILYKIAVYSWANALLNEQYINFDATAKAKSDIIPDVESTGNLYRNARNAIRDILGKSRSTMELI